MVNNYKGDFLEFVAFSIEKCSISGGHLQLNNLTNSNYWDEHSQTLYVQVNGKGEINEVSHNISVENTSNKEHLVNVSYTSNGGESYELQSLSVVAETTDQFNHHTGFIGINYNDLPNISNIDTANGNELGVYNNIVDQQGSQINSHEEVDDYSFLNVINEEIVTLNPSYDVSDLRSVLQESLSDSRHYHNNDHNSLANANFDHLIDNFSNSSEYKVYLHNMADISYLEIVNHSSHDYNLALDGVGGTQLDNSSIDSILHSIVEHQNKA